jgi:ribosomal protein S18 acetylase RimI-like enzyme
MSKNIEYSYIHNSGLAKTLLSKHLDHGFLQTFLLEAKLLGKTPDDFNMKDIEEKCKDLTDATFNFVLAMDGDKLAGVLALRPNDPREIQMLWVEEAYRKRKVGSKLVNALSRDLRLPLKVECLKGNAAALNFYTELGFEFVDKARFPTNLVGYTKVKLE